jgi:hypothetical protein
MRISLKTALLTGAFISLAMTGSAFAGAVFTSGNISYFGSPSTILTGTAQIVPQMSQSPQTIQLGSDGSVTVTPSSPGAIVSGSLNNAYAAPITDAAGTPYAENYFSTGLTSPTISNSNLSVSSSDAGVINFQFNSEQKYLGLLWGSVDGGTGAENVLSFYNNGLIVGSLTGAEIATAAGIPGSGIQTYGGSAYINADISGGFNQVVAGSQKISFEFAAVTASSTTVPVPVPEPGSLLLLGTSMIGLGIVLRSRRRA